jgi:F-type H+-transporting ATPase subunit delta
MPKKVYGRRYAQAVFELALEKNELERWQSDLQQIAGAVADKDFLAALESPKIAFKKKSELLSARLKDINPLALNLVYLLIARSGIGMVADIAAEYQRLLDSYRGIEQAEVITAVPLDENDMKKLTARLGAVVGKEVVVKAEVDPEILGGIIARIGGKLLDGSTRSKLIALKRELVGTERRR